MNARDAAARLRVMGVTSASSKKVLLELADWLEKGAEVSLAEASLAELFKATASRGALALTVVANMVNGKEVVSVQAAGMTSGCVGLADVAKRHLCRKMSTQKKATWDEK
jgi:hypothetical protein